MRKKLLFAVFLLMIFSLSLGQAAAQEPSSPVVKAVLFFSPTCGHCQTVINEVLIPLVDEYGEQLQILAVDVTQGGGGGLFGEVINYLGIPPEEAGVPILIVGETVLRGSREIPEQFPGMVSNGLNNGGISWPPMPPILASLPSEDQQADQTAADQQPLAEPEALDSAVTAPPPDPVGFTLAGIILVGMVGSLGYSIRRVGNPIPGAVQPDRNTSKALGYTKNRLYSWGVPLLGVLGAGVSGYLAYVEFSQAAAVCGPVGECNLVQASPYARLFGVVPVAVLGLLFYLAILGAYFAIEQGALRASGPVVFGLIGLPFLGTLFSVYLTVVEIFLIKAVCMWCLTSAVLTTGLLVIYSREYRSLIHRA